MRAQGVEDLLLSVSFSRCYLSPRLWRSLLLACVMVRPTLSAWVLHSLNIRTCATGTLPWPFRWIALHTLHLVEQCLWTKSHSTWRVHPEVAWNLALIVFFSPFVVDIWIISDLSFPMQGWFWSIWGRSLIFGNPYQKLSSEVRSKNLLRAASETDHRFRTHTPTPPPPPPIYARKSAHLSVGRYFGV